MFSENWFDSRTEHPSIRLHVIIVTDPCSAAPHRFLTQVLFEKRRQVCFPLIGRFHGHSPIPLDTLFLYLSDSSDGVASLKCTVSAVWRIVLPRI